MVGPRPDVDQRGVQMRHAATLAGPWTGTRRTGSVVHRVPVTMREMSRVGTCGIRPR